MPDVLDRPSMTPSRRATSRDGVRSPDVSGPATGQRGIGHRCRTPGAVGVWPYSCTARVKLSTGVRNYGGIRLAMHPGWRRCSSLTYCPFSDPSRRAPTHSPWRRSACSPSGGSSATTRSGRTTASAGCRPHVSAEAVPFAGVDLTGKLTERLGLPHDGEPDNLLTCHGALPSSIVDSPSPAVDTGVHHAASPRFGRRRTPTRVRRRAHRARRLTRWSASGRPHSTAGGSRPPVGRHGRGRQGWKC